VGSLVYSIVSQNRKLDLVFDWDKMLSFEGNSAPYIQYTHARAKSVLRKAGESTALTRSLPAGERSKGRGSVTSVSQRQAKTLLSRGERLLLRTLQLYPKVLEDARATHMPHKLANFLYQLCQDFNAFYNSDDIVKAEEPSRSLRLQLTDLTARVLQSGAGLLTLRLPERM
jgi:arginyl-tRNA synthetase